MSSHSEIASRATDTPAPFTARERWTLVVSSLWLVIGLQLDAYAHATTPDLETFWTPWHAVLYSGIAACGFVLLWLLRSRLPKVITYHGLLRETPAALRLPVVGMAMLLVGGGIDTLWHNLFGIEKELEIFTSPSHYLIIGGMVLVAIGPALMLADSPVRRLGGGDAALVTISALLAVLPLHIYSRHASVLGEPQLGTGDNPMDVWSLDGQMLHGYFGSTVLLLLPILLISRRWGLPLGMPMLLMALQAALVWLMFGDPGDEWLFITVALASAAVELLSRLLLHRLPGLSVDARWMLLGFSAPILLWGAVFAVGEATVGVGWGLHVMSGILTFAALTGLGTAFVVRRIQISS
ncbi:hypothetical protein BH11ACT6_BH11ACT6_03200 [soil metagenome]